MISSVRHSPVFRARAATLAGACCALLLLPGLAGCDRGMDDRSTRATDPDEPRIERVQRGPIEVALTVDPPRVSLTDGILLTVTATAEGPTPPTLPPLNDRLSGLELVGQYDGEIVEAGGKIIVTRFFQLTPALDSEHRIAPMAVTLHDAWVATPPIVLPRVPVGETPDDIVEELKPHWIPPAFRTVASWLAGLLLCIAAVFGLWKLLKRVRRKIQLARMSPRERAMQELDELLERHLPEQDMVKEFYFELTMIVRRYIERAHHVRAPEQTTEEFLETVSVDNRFGPKVVEKLREFMSSADLVKYAAYEPDSEAVATATGTARTYIDTDAEDAMPADSASEEPALETTHV